jgi:uncharacterized membrane protein
MPMPTGDNRPSGRSEYPTTAHPGGIWLTWRSLSGPGLVVGAVFLAFSLTPSLIPRSLLFQGALAGICFAIGYSAGVLLRALWMYLDLPIVGIRGRLVGTWVAAAVAAMVVIVFAWRAADQQNSIRVLMDMPPVESARPLEVVLIAIVVFAVLVLVARLIGALFGRISRRADRYVPVKVSRVIAIALSAVLVLVVVNGVLYKGIIRSADYSLRTLDELMEPDVAQPSDPMRTGSDASLVRWTGLGRKGRAFVSSGPSRAELEQFLGRPAIQPIRVYAGLGSADNVEARAELALDELVRVGGFERSILVVAVPTGTGWMDPGATDTLEYLHAGDTAIVAVQYSYLTSPISLFVEPGYSIAAGRALFRAVYQYWSALPKGGRPRLYLHGLSLGAFSSEQSFRLHEVIADPFYGAVWSGPPFASPEWRSATRERNPGSPEWLPRFGDGSIIRFTNQNNSLDIQGAHWGPMRLVYLQYASDPITFFSGDTFYRKPDWMEAPLGPDVSPEMRWYPAVTFLQLIVDMAVGLSVPIGFGHNFAPQHYIDAWIAVTEPQGWTKQSVERLKARFAAGRER